ncbi:low affinity immunoglobulin gamma Fc region receptor IV-like isoform X1 [Microtus oregoni]|uniref:low affinity immunoglobulin gamma Fc region receptor IV-like n=2 Tax=Microtus oregoni TaxID=111838 RepID=UPI001BB212D0|nr:low affinity immunoglobulin gamma Fc region receptor IV-like [Microtus oregoni]XP_041518583.1 low affinity immunoglobulin gamma Fc region receptor IV-like isoform X1 [Microtus oregoni]
MCPRLLPTALLLLVSSGIRAGFQKAVVILDPKWVRVLKDDNVTLRCQATYSPEDNSTKWFHNGSLIPHQHGTYVIRNATVNDSGEYKCQTALSTLSDPVNLEVHIGWLLLQTTQRPEFQEGDPIRLNCHSWKNKPVHKVTYLQNGKGKKYFHWNSELYIPSATQNHSGSYFCRGLIGQNNKSSEALRIIVRGPTSSSTSPPPWPRITFCLLTGLLFAIDTVLCFSVQRSLRRPVADYEEPELHWSKEPEDKTISGEKKSFRSSRDNSEAPEST